VTPVYLIALLAYWGYQDGIPILLMRNRKAADVPYLWAARGLMLALTLLALALIWWAYRRGTLRDGEPVASEVAA
jgi:membrane protease YdiL (CAAX protease family)